MCGISGIAGSIRLKHEDIFKDLLVLHQVRGVDSTGACSVPRLANNEVKILKTTESATELVYYDKRFDKLLMGQHLLLLGHNRSATVGNITQRNAHPFIFNDTIGVHNGTIDWFARDKLDPKKQFDTDSEALIYAIDKDGPQKVFPELEGAWTVVWFDLKTNSLSMIRNDKRPLFYVLTENKNVLMFGSELNLLFGAAYRDGRDIKLQKAQVLPTDTLFTWAIPAVDQPFDDPKRIKLPGKQPIARNIITYGHNQHGMYKKPEEGKKQSGFTVIGGGSSSDLVPYLQEGGRQIFRDIKNNIWQIWTWDDKLTFWDKRKARFAPPDLDLPVLDINSRHEFVHKGKKKKKKIFYLGPKKCLLNKVEFEAIMANGCGGCARIPKWGNKVEWVTNVGDFLCEFCALDKDLIDTWKSIGVSDSGETEQKPTVESVSGV